jgi:hypothetical protein
VLFGGHVPFILKRKDDYYLLIGECDIESLMKGQAIERYEKGELKDQYFELH